MSNPMNGGNLEDLNSYYLLTGVPLSKILEKRRNSYSFMEHIPQDKQITRVGVSGKEVKDKEIFLCYVDNAEINSCKISNSTLYNSSVTKTDIGSSLIIQTNIRDKCRIEYSKIYGGAIKDVTTSHSEIIGAYICRSKITDTEIKSMKFKNISYTEIDPRKVDDMDIENSIIKNSRIMHENISSSRIDGGTLIDVHVRDSTLSNLDINYSEIVETRIRKSKINGGTIISSDISETRIGNERTGYVLMIDTKPKECSLEHATLIFSDKSKAEEMKKNIPTLTIGEQCSIGIQDSKDSGIDIFQAIKQGKICYEKLTPTKREYNKPAKGRKI